METRPESGRFLLLFIFCVSFVSVGLGMAKNDVPLSETFVYIQSGFENPDSPRYQALLEK